MTASSVSTSANLGREETAGRASAIRPERIAVSLDVTGAPDPDRLTFGTRAELVFAATAPETWVDFLGESVDEVVLNGAPQEIDWDGARIRVRGLADSNRLVIRAQGRYSSSGEGLHRFRDPVDDETYLYTQYEPADARRVYPCWEQPDLKAHWDMEVIAPDGWTVLSGGAEIASDPVDGGRRHRFATTELLSSYITAVAAGPYHEVRAARRENQAGEPDISLGVFCRRSLAPYLDADEILEVTCRGLDLFEDAFAFPYPWGKYDQIFVPEYNLGAMENPGLVTFTEAYIFRGPATSAQREARANTILHEMAHMWFGDLVTMRWWDDLWLKESFADFMGSYANVATGLHPDAWVAFASRRKGWAYEQDQLPTTHPIVADIPDLEAAKLNFDGITYAKGASVLKQLVAFVGEDAFFAGARRYFADHAYGNTTLDDLLAALASASGRDLGAWSAAWLETTGMSELRAERVAGGLQLHQTDPRPHRLSIGLYDAAAGELTLRARIPVDVSGESTFVEAEVTSDTVVILNDTDTTYAKVRVDATSLRLLEGTLHTLDDPLARSVVWSALWNAVRDGDLSVTRYLALVVANAPAETSVALLADALAHAVVAASTYSDPAERDENIDRLLALVWAGLDGADPGSGAQRAWARALAPVAALTSTSATRLHGILAGTEPAPTGLDLDPDLRWSWLNALAATGHVTADDIESELARDPSSRGRSAALSARWSAPEASVRADAWRSAWSDLSLTNEHLDATIAGVRAGSRRDLIATFDEDYFDRIRDVWQNRSIEIARRLVRGLFPAAENLQAVDAWLAANADAPAALRRVVIEQRDGLARSLRVRAAQAPLDA